MKTLLLSCLFFVYALTFSQSERDVIVQIDSMNTLALKYYNNNDIVKSFNLFNQSIKLSDSIDDSYGNALANFSLGRIYAYMLENIEAENCFNKMLIKGKEVKDNFLIASAYLNLGNIKKADLPLNNLLPYYEEALEYALKEELLDQYNIDKQQNILFDICISLSQVYLKYNQSEQALIYLLRAETSAKKLEDNLFALGYVNYIHGLYFSHKGLTLNANKKYQVSSNFLEKLNNLEQSGCALLLSKVYRELSISFAALEKNTEAYNMLLKHSNYNSKFLNEEKVKQENILKSKLLLENYKYAAQLANNERIQQAQVTEKIKNVNLIITITLILLFVTLVTLLINYVSKQKLSKVLKYKNEQLEIAKDEAIKSSELKTKFISNVTHELRTPLYGVVGITSLLLKKNNLSAIDNKYLTSLKYSGDYLLNLVNDILQIGKIEAEKIELKQVTVNLKKLIDNLVGSFEYRLQETNNQINLTFDENIPEYIKCDNVRLSQILFNLIGNSVKFTQNGIITLKVLMLNNDTNNVSLRFEIEDNGPGIPIEKQSAIFENFSQLDENNNVNYQGTGLGLSITKNLVKLFNSKIELESDLGQGAKFSFNVSFEIDKVAKSIIQDKKENGKTFSIGNKFKILVVEDNKINQIVTQNLLKKENYQCEIAQNGLEALNKVKINTYDLILMDINMPIMNGNDATIAIRKINPNIPILALTAADIEEVRVKYKDIGYNDIITKPFDNYEFFQAITTNIEKNRSNSDCHLNLVKVS